MNWVVLGWTTNYYSTSLKIYNTFAIKRWVIHVCVAERRIKASVYDVGISGTKYPPTINDVKTKEYGLWQNMLERCYSDAYKKKHPTYKDCEASENFKSFEYFYEWCNKQIGFGNEGWHLDKDLLIKGNKVYSEDSCIFIPNEINLLLTKRTTSRGKHLIGVCWHKTKKAFVARVNKNKGKSEHLGYFNTELEAFKAYKRAKESLLKNKLISGNHKLTQGLTML